MASVVVVAALVLAGGIALAYSLGGGSQPTATTSSTVPTTAHAGAARPSTGHAGSPGGSASSSSTTTTTTTTPVVPGAAPVISALSPSTGAPGQSVQIAGSNFLSPDGHIVASFNGQVTSTSCPAPNACTITVPPSSGAASAQVTITTASGTSNAATFTYS